MRFAKNAGGVRRPYMRLRDSVADRPLFFYTLYGLSPRTRQLRVRKTTELVIEGFPRSANSFVVVAFQQAQKKGISIAHHLHVPAQIQLAVRWKIPCIVLIREPLEAISSLLIRDKWRDPSRTLKYYIRFYKTVLTCQPKRYLIADFKVVTSCFGDVIENLNNMFGVSFSSFNHSPSNVNRVFSKLEEFEKKYGSADEEMVSRPSKEREYKKEIIIRQLHSPALKSLVERAEGMYDSLINFQKLS
jgi:hypothetical protein